jgi:hypothetical protein
VAASFGSVFFMPSCKSAAGDGELAIQRRIAKRRHFADVAFLPLQTFAYEVSVLSPFLSWDVVSAEKDK